VVITLTPADLYDVAFYAMRGANARVVNESTGIYAESLREVFTSATGLHTSL
jgi:hypothetical protein